MNFIERYQFFLFDFDGLLVNTEELHYLAYKKMMARHGVELTWSFERYCQSAHYSSEKLREDLSTQFPALMRTSWETSWETLYEEKQAEMRKLLQEGAQHLMPGVAPLLMQLQRRKIKHCVVTHSPDDLIALVRKQQPLLDHIPYWITRHDYTHPKPDPECYLLAIKRFSQPADHIIGFEDTPRGLKALLGTRAKAILITQVPYPEIPDFIKQGVEHFASLDCLD